MKKKANLLFHAFHFNGNGCHLEFLNGHQSKNHSFKCNAILQTCIEDNYLSLLISGKQINCISVYWRRVRPKKRWRDNIKEDTKKYQLTKDMAQDRKYWMTKILAGPAQGDGQ